MTVTEGLPKPGDPEYRPMLGIEYATKFEHNGMFGLEWYQTSALEISSIQTTTFFSSVEAREYFIQWQSQIEKTSVISIKLADAEERLARLTEQLAEPIKQVLDKARAFDLGFSSKDPE